MSRNPVTFSNGTLVQKAQVEVDGTTYEVEPAQFSGTTPLSASNLNLLQTRLYDYVDNEISEVESDITNLTNNVYVKDNFALVSGSISLQGMEENTLEISLPTGWTDSNCFIIGVKYTKNNSWPSYTSYDDYIKYIQIISNTSNARVHINNNQSNSATYNVTLLLLKYSD